MTWLFDPTSAAPKHTVEVVLSRKQFPPILRHAIREERLGQLMTFLRSKNRGDGIVLATTRDMLNHFESDLAVPDVHSRATVLSYLSTLETRGKVQRLPFADIEGLPVDQQGLHGFKRGAIRLSHRNPQVEKAEGG